MKFEKQIFASAAAAALMLNASLLGAETPESAALKLPRRDIPWVSLKHQRELEAKAIDAAVITAEQRAEEERKRKELERQSSFLTRFTKDSAPKVTADKFDYAQDGSGKLSASGNVVVEDKNFGSQDSFGQDKVGYRKRRHAVGLFQIRFVPGLY